MDFLEQFIKFEEQYGLLLDKVDDFSYWAYARFEIYNRLLEKKITNRGTAHFVAAKIKGKDFINILNSILAAYIQLYRNKNKILFLAHSRRVLIDNKYECIYTDRLADRFGTLSLRTEFMYGYTHFKPTYQKVFYLDFLELYAGIKYRFIKKKYSREKVILKRKAAYVSQAIYKEFSISLDKKILEDHFIGNYLRYKQKKKLFFKFLKRLNPKIVINVVGYSFNNMIFNEVAKKLGIGTIELQHGIVGKGHIAYNYFVERNYEFLPDKMFFFSDYWAKTCRFPIGNNNKYVTGYPYLEEQLKKFPPQYNLNNTRIKILFLSQPTCNERLIKISEDLLEYVQNKYQIEIYFKLHPHEYNDSFDKYRKLLQFSNFYLINNSKISLYKLFSIVGIQVGATSTAIYEGLAYKLKTYIYHIEGTDECMGDLCSLGYAEMFDNSNELYNKINDYYSVEQNFSVEYSQFFENNSLDKMTNIINKFIK